MAKTYIKISTGTHFPERMTNIQFRSSLASNLIILTRSKLLKLAFTPIMVSHEYISSLKSGKQRKFEIFLFCLTILYIFLFHVKEIANTAVSFNPHMHFFFTPLDFFFFYLVFRTELNTDTRSFTHFFCFQRFAE